MQPDLRHVSQLPLPVNLFLAKYEAKKLPDGGYGPGIGPIEIKA